MPEGDTVALVCRRLDAALAGDILTRAELRTPRWATTDLVGWRVTAVVPRGKHQLIRLHEGHGAAGLTLHTQLRLTGSWRFARTGDRWPGPDHEIRVVLGTARGVALGLRVPVINLVATSDEDQLLGHLGPDLLGSDWDADAAVRRLRRAPGRSVAAALLDQRNLAGLGTFWTAEVLFSQRIHPRRPISDLTELDLVAIVERAHQLLAGAVLGRRQTTTGVTNGPDRGFVYGRAGRACLRCRTRIEFWQIDVTDAMGLGQPRDRNGYFCPRCQPE